LKQFLEDLPHFTGLLSDFEYFSRGFRNVSAISFRLDQEKIIRQLLNGTTLVNISA
jgi:hypothetical protein